MYGLAITPYGDPIPPNAFASEDMDRFREAFEPRRMLRFFSTQEIRFTNLAETVLDGSDLSRDAILDCFDTSMKGTKPGGPGKNVVLLYLSAHGVLDAQGNACLLFGPRFGSTDEAGWRQQLELERHLVFVPVLDIIQRCRKAIDEGRTPRARTASWWSSWTRGRRRRSGLWASWSMGWGKRWSSSCSDARTCRMS